jgi:cyclic beta-1,2-glucan synthetase
VKPAISTLAPRRLLARALTRQGEGADELLAGPIRGELLGADHLAERAVRAAREQEVARAGRGRGQTPLLARLRSTRRILAAANDRLTAAAAEGGEIGPAGEWFLDNYHVVLEHMREVRESLPTGYYRELPELARGPLAGYPRVYEHAITLISHTEGRIDLENVQLFIGSVQTVVPLTIGELWAVPAMLRLGLLESVRRMALRTVQRLAEVEAADRWAERLIEANEAGDSAIAAQLNEFVNRTPTLTATFVSRFLHQLRMSRETFASVVWLEQWIAEDGLTAEDAARQSTQRLAITQIMMANSIVSLRTIARMDWRRLVERESAMDAVLREDPSGDYARMTFATRDHYRHVVERIAKRTGADQPAVARRAVERARQHATGGSREAADVDDSRRSHVGFWLVDDGLEALERDLGYRSPTGEALHRAVLRHPNVVFVGGTITGTWVALAGLFWLAGPVAWSAPWLVIAVALLPAADIAVNVMNQLVSAFLPPRVLPKLDLHETGVPAEFRTAVVIPTLFPDVASVGAALENLEVQFLANREAHLHFALLSDYTDADRESSDSDPEILAAAIDGVRELNDRYAGGEPTAFYLFHRTRRWNEREGVWMGWERKRGKLAQLNRFLRGGDPEAFSTVVGDVETIRQVRYVITLDSDTVLPPDAAPLLIGAIAHPLNRAVYDGESGRVVRGYGILQPRVGVSLPSAHRSRFAAVHSGHPGVDPYTTAVSDVYQDLYGEGSFTGKGIYDVDAFERSTRGRFPENRLLSHDLIEGSYARAGLATDITVFDDYPTRYLTYTRRKHRWMRGDWQLLDWLTPRVPAGDGSEPNRLSLLSRWKIFDNLRRSTVEIAQVVFLVAAWLILPGSALRWTLLVLLAVTAPWIVALLLALLRPPLDKSWRAYYAAVGRDAVTSSQQAALAIAFLPHQAWVSADAIVRTLWRVLVSRRRLLEWQTASQTEMATGSGGEWRIMAPAVVFALLAFAAVAVAAGSEGCGATGGASCVLRNMLPELPAVLPLVALWIASPLIARALSAPAVRPEGELSDADRGTAMRYALLHWRFFDRFVGEETGWLAPDNFQEDPSPEVAMRTSPTNIGLQLLSITSARDLGFITTDDMTRRLELALRAMERMRRFRGHLYNWYRLPELAVLEPSYISTVDSGNLAGHLVALRQACLAIPDEPLVDGRLWDAIDTAIDLAGELEDPLAERGDGRWHASPPVAGVGERVRAVRAAVESARTSTSPAPVFGPAEVAVSNATSERVEGSGRTKDGGVVGAIAHVLGPLDDLRAALAGGGGEVGGEADGDGRASGPRIGIPGIASAHVEAANPRARWIDWSIALLRQHAALLRDYGVAEADGPIPSLRQAAATSTEASHLVSGLEAIANRAQDYAAEMDFRFLFDRRRKLFSIGYQEQTHSLDPSYYDLLASEARLASFIAIARNDVPVDHWFHLGRTLTHSAGATALVSWSGSMFEYLMPALVMRSYPFTVLEHTIAGAVRTHVAYGREHDVPWGVSESAFNIRDRHLTYQYRAFGVPGLALKRGLGRDLVIAPYASLLAVMVEPVRAFANLRALEKTGALGPYGFRDAIDYTRPLPGHRFAIVGTYMAHHIGMGLVALSNVLLGRIWQHRFHSDPMVRSAELLLHERIPRRLVFQEAQPTRTEEALPDPELELPAVREFDRPDTSIPHVALLGRLPYTIMVSHCGGGYSNFEGMAVTRWRSDGTRDNTGQFCYVKDITRQRTWSAAHQPMCVPADWSHTLLATDRVTFHRGDGGIETRMEVAVVPEDSAEVRRVTLTNVGGEPRDVEVTSYGEVVLAPPDTDRAHPAFANLFVETEWHEWCTAITATRRPRSASERRLWCVHVADTGRHRVGRTSCETDRAGFLGRGRSTHDPLALDHDGELSGTTGAVLDPMMSLRVRMHLAPGQSASVAFTTIVATSRERAFELADRYHDPHTAQRALDLAWTSTQLELRELGITPSDAAVFQELAGHLLYSSPELRASQEELCRNRGSQQLLWSSGISGDRPILLATIDSVAGLPTIRQLFAAHHYWRRRGMMVDLVVLNTKEGGYLQELNDRITGSVFASSEAGVFDRPGGVFVRRADALGAELLLMIRATARVHIHCDGRAVGRIMDGVLAPHTIMEPPEGLPDLDSFIVPITRRRPAVAEHTKAAIREMMQATADFAAPAEDEFVSVRTNGGDRSVSSAKAPERPPVSGAGASGVADGDAGPISRGAEAEASGPAGRESSYPNGHGALTAGNEYEMGVRSDHLPPAPWSNVIANEAGGFVVTERGGGFTWAENSYFYRLTPWHNDPVTDPVSEAIYIRDSVSGETWCATPAPVRDSVAYTVVHGAGRSTFEHDHGGLVSHLTLGMAGSDPVKLSVLRLTNNGAEKRRIRITAFAEWTLGVTREHTQHQVHTRFDAGRGAIFARNWFDEAFASRVAFHALSEPVTAHTGDRREFVGRNGNASDPAGLRSSLSGTTGAGYDPCSALQCEITLEPGESREVVVLLGAADGVEASEQMLDGLRGVERARSAIERGVARWDARLSVISVRTPEPSFDAMINRWSLYQALCCRMWARSALYQSSGAFGFRDQLQDVMAFVYAEPAIAREHIVRASARQFPEGDVQHWWHPHSGRGVRTRFSDDLVWLPYVVDHYVRVTGDVSVLDEYTPFLLMRPLEEHEHEVYDLPGVSEEHASVYEHCLRALRRASTRGPHGLPLIGSGDWNDGMSRVGIEGKGESVWLAWFLVTTLRSFAVHAEKRGDDRAAAELRANADDYAEAVERAGWDGEWYRRAYFDDGTPLGSSGSLECRIDSIAQSWSVISGAGDPDRRLQAMQSLETHLVREDARLLMLLTPPFDRMPNDPGYIKGYLPGVRENGAQYTHAALWAVQATAIAGNGDRAFELFQMINPLTHARTPDEVAVYKVEPYVVAADVYTAEGQLGRGGWTWYTGSASWMYRVGLESILGFELRADRLFIRPNVPTGWEEYSIEYRRGGTVYSIRVRGGSARGANALVVSVDGDAVHGEGIPLSDDGGRHEVVVRYE